MMKTKSRSSVLPGAMRRPVLVLQEQRPEDGRGVWLEWCAERGDWRLYSNGRPVAHGSVDFCIIEGAGALE